ncbi:disease susceptibility protein lov1 [Quercus suber]|uniref:Disease susceptibility protein lov1 n=1 Tax=Quercus suber TaxID=58331 RepID=A0AAW0KIW8_QUESU
MKLHLGRGHGEGQQSRVHEVLEFKIFEDMEKLGREMVARCVGLPLAIIVLGGLLATIETLDEWDIVHRNIKLHLGRGHDEGQQSRVHEVLVLSYFELPY